LGKGFSSYRKTGKEFRRRGGLLRAAGRMPPPTAGGCCTAVAATGGSSGREQMYRIEKLTARIRTATASRRFPLQRKKGCTMSVCKTILQLYIPVCIKVYFLKLIKGIVSQDGVSTKTIHI
jgi:hypothetical protein